MVCVTANSGSFSLSETVKNSDAFGGPLFARNEATVGLPTFRRNHLQNQGRFSPRSKVIQST